MKGSRGKFATDGPAERPKPAEATGEPMTAMPFAGPPSRLILKMRRRPVGSTSGVGVGRLLSDEDDASAGGWVAVGGCVVFMMFSQFSPAMKAAFRVSEEASASLMTRCRGSGGVPRRLNTLGRTSPWPKAGRRRPRKAGRRRPRKATWFPPWKVGRRPPDRGNGRRPRPRRPPRRTQGQAWKGHTKKGKPLSILTLLLLFFFSGLVLILRSSSPSPVDDGEMMATGRGYVLITCLGMRLRNVICVY